MEAAPLQIVIERQWYYCPVLGEHTYREIEVIIIPDEPEV